MHNHVSAISGVQLLLYGPCTILGARSFFIGHFEGRVLATVAIGFGSLITRDKACVALEAKHKSCMPAT
jgi:hypothetical protein